MYRFFRFFIFNLLLLVTLVGCKNDPLRSEISGMDIEISIPRFDQELFTLDFDTIERAVPWFYHKYNDFFDIFNVHVINIGPASAKYYSSYLSMFVNDPTNQELYAYTQNIFPEMDKLEEQLSLAFRRYHYYFPDSLIPQPVAFISGFNHKMFTIGNYIGIGLDQYLGVDCPYYDLLGTPVYMQRNMHPGKIASDIIQTWGSANVPFNDSIDNVLNRMIYEGMLLYLTDLLLPEIPDSLKIGFTAEQIKFCKSNEKQMWTFLVEHDLLFSDDQLEIRKLTEDAPNTYYFPDASPGRAAVWIGWQIIREYIRRNPQQSIPEFYSNRDYQSILRGSRYNP